MKNVKAKDSPWDAVLMGSVASTVLPKILLLLLSASALHAQNWWDTYIPKTPDEVLFFQTKPHYAPDPRLEDTCPWSSIQLISVRWTRVQIDILVKKTDYHAFDRSELEEDLHQWYYGADHDQSNMVRRGFPVKFKTTGQSTPLHDHYELLSPSKGFDPPLPAKEGKYYAWSWKVLGNDSLMGVKDAGDSWHISMARYLLHRFGQDED